MSTKLFFEGDYIKTIDGLFFAVKGTRHSNEMIIATLRYIPDQQGERELNGKKFRRVYDIDSTSQFLQKNHPNYFNYINWLDMELQSIPTSHIERIYKPKTRLEQIQSKPKSELEKIILNFIEVLSTCSGVSISCFGVSGSLLIGLDNESSDIDINVYGENEGRRVYDALSKLRSSETWISSYDINSINRVLESRWGATEIKLEKMNRVECEKILHGMVQGVDYFIRLLVNDDLSYSTPIDKITITCTITDDSKSIYTPCIYKVKDVITDSPVEYMVSELKSYRGKFTEQVKKGDQVKAYGTLERVSDNDDLWYRLILGQSSDYLIPT